ncbi:peptide ABC transporter substrate-binding protein [Virgibacillus phasianinus]|uniref:Peptide ABC transporter substrate-binding protein n=1 Tax=Virgibacillus phasianinus TaxID=2017483 RepID=A0A220U127_9BACI|nr:peptide ABC transporter substrate-binding protein [Virgibacillus phasianinus]ASK61715.1 peptide ABC transporter substrate-binding protein [Virgibacillus phasianinus]
MKLTKFSMLILMGLLLSVFMVACSSDDTSSDTSKSSTSSDEKQVLNLTNGDTIPSMDSSLAADEYGFQFLGATTEGLYRLGKDAKIVDGIATDHKVSDDALTWTFTLREDAVWSNGDPVTAHDFVYAWQRAINPDTGSEYGPYMMNGVIKNATAINNGEMPVEKLGVKAKDDFTLVVTLEKPIPYFESLMTFGTFLPLNQKFVESKGDKYGTSSENLLSNGPFKLTDWKSTSTSWKLVKNEDYWDADTVSLDKITFDVVKDPQVAVDLYEKGEVDRAGLSSDLVDRYSTHEDYTVTPETSVFYFKFNEEASDALANKNIRNAISRAFDKQALVDEVLNDGSIVANGLIPKNFASMPESGEDFREVNGDLITYDPEKAKELWEKGLEEIGKDKVQIEFLADDGASAKNMNEYLANQLETNLEGLDIKLKQVPFEQRLDLSENMNYELQVYGWGPDYLDPYTFLNMYITGSQYNKMGYSNEKYDKLMKKSATDYVTDPAKRYNAFLEAEKVLMDDAAIAPIYQSARAQLIKPYVKGVISNPFGPTYEWKWASIEK